MAKLLITLLALISVVAAEPYIPAAYASTYSNFGYPWAAAVAAPEAVVWPYGTYAPGFGAPAAYTLAGSAAVAPAAAAYSLPAAAAYSLPPAAPAIPAFTYPYPGFQSAFAEYILPPFRK